jgi:hypothetical protein
VTPTHRTTRRLDRFPCGYRLPAGSPVEARGGPGPPTVVVRLAGGGIAVVPADALEAIGRREEEKEEPTP